MRLLFLIPELLEDTVSGKVLNFAKRHRRLWHLPLLRRRLISPHLLVDQTYGGTLNIMRHCSLVRKQGVDAALLTPRGKNTYGQFSIVDVPYVAWSDIRNDDICLIPEFCSKLVDQVKGPVIVYLQVPTLLAANFDYLSPRVRLWTDSPFMLARAQAVFPNKAIEIVPNVVDPIAFPFRPQSERESGVIFAFPRKGLEFIRATQEAYARQGGSFWRFELIDGLPLFELARQMQRPQAFLASADVEGCALPPQESMAAGIVVVGKSASGANFSMKHRETAMLAETPELAATSLRELESAELRDEISRNAHAFIRRYFPDGEPGALWKKTLGELGVTPTTNGV